MANAQRQFENIRPTPQQLRMLAAGLAIVVAALHLFHPRIGMGRLALMISLDPGLLWGDPRPLAFVLSAIILLLGVLLGAVGYPRKRLYLGGMALMATYVVGYFAWHATGHGGFLPGREPLFHDLGPLELVVSHMIGDLWAATAKFTELALLITLLVLYRREF